MVKDRINIIIAEDHTLYREAVIRELIPYNIHCVGEAATGAEIFQFLEQKRTSILLLDLEMPEMNGKEAFIQIKKKYPFFKIMIISQHDDKNLTEHFEELGAQGYLPKAYISGNVSFLAEAINDVNIGKTCFVYGLDKKYVKYTNREREIIPLICDGRTNREIAKILELDEKTIEKHRKNLYGKTNSKNVGSFIKYSIKRGLDFLGGK